MVLFMFVKHPSYFYAKYLTLFPDPEVRIENDHLPALATGGIPINVSLTKHLLATVNPPDSLDITSSKMTKANEAWLVDEGIYELWENNDVVKECIALLNILDPAIVTLRKLLIGGATLDEIKEILADKKLDLSDDLIDVFSLYFFNRSIMTREDWRLFFGTAPGQIGSSLGLVGNIKATLADIGELPTPELADMIAASNNLIYTRMIELGISGDISDFNYMLKGHAALLNAYKATNAANKTELMKIIESFMVDLLDSNSGHTTLNQLLKGDEVCANTDSPKIIEGAVTEITKELDEKLENDEE